MGKWSVVCGFASNNSSGVLCDTQSVTYDALAYLQAYWLAHGCKACDTLDGLLVCYSERGRVVEVSM